ncbi:MAG: S8 family serine peptidase [Proteobacteria bacterium]|nr:S8 family serine peptidase [Pseudomonadota bacterium]
MAKKEKTVAKRKNDGPMNPGTSVVLGGERFDLSKSTNYFTVKKRRGAQMGILEATKVLPENFPQLSFLATHSTLDVEVYGIKAQSLDQAMDILRKQGTDVEWCAHVYHMPGDPKGLMIPTDKLYVEIEVEAEPEAVNKLLDDHGLELVSQDEDDSHALLLRLTSDSRENPIKIANALSKSKYVKLAEPDFGTAISLKAFRPADPLFPQQWHLENRGGFLATAGADVSAPDAWETTRGDRSIVVCVMDDGVDTRHVEFSSPKKIVAPRDFGQDDIDPTPVRNGRGSFGDNHGTACAGVAVADENGTGVVGIAPWCALMPIRTSGLISSDTIEELFGYARRNEADVISCSWGVNAEFFTLSTRMKRAIERAANQGRDGKGCVILFAAGNEDSPVDGVKNGRRVRSGFAIHPDVIAVAASNSRDVRSHYSNFGPEIWVSAPSSGRGGRGILTTDRTGSVGYEEGDYTINDPFGGTSSATPLVAGICGLILSVNPSLTAADVRDILKVAADKIDQQNGNYNSQGHSDLYGWGRVNASSAVREAVRRIPPPNIIRTRVFERAPALPIPDNQTTGVTDTVSVSEPGMVVSVKVALNITHTYRGDLHVSLVGPDDSIAVLHNRTGGRADNLIREYTVDDTNGLAVFRGKSAVGNWTLHVRDLARVDLGTLDKWTLTLGLDGAPRTIWETFPGLSIPDDDPQGVVSELEVEGTGALRDMELMVDITHTYRGDLRVSLETPSGTNVPIHRRTGGREDHLQRSYKPSDTLTLRNLVDSGVEINGVWKLHVSDHARIDVGKLNHWRLKLLS